MASVLNFYRGAHLHLLMAAILGGGAKSADLTSLLSYEWIEIETVACLVSSRDINFGPAWACQGWGRLRRIREPWALRNRASWGAISNSTVPSLTIAKLSS